MGLDATVRCRCFEEGKIKPGPLPLDDLYIARKGASRRTSWTRLMRDLRTGSSTPGTVISRGSFRNGLTLAASTSTGSTALNG